MDEIIRMFIETGSKRMDGVHGEFEYKIYWAGTILRIDLKPLLGGK